MKDSILVTITTLHNSKQYTITQLIKKFIIFFIVFIIFVIIGTLFFIEYLNKLVEQKDKEVVKKNEVILKKEDIITQKNRKIDIFEKQKVVLENKIKILENNITSLENEIDKKEKFLESVNDRIDDLERIIQFNPPKNIDVNERIDLAKLDIIDKKFVLRNIPNGTPVKFLGITSKFGWRKHPLLKRREFHTGIDMRASMNTPVYATADGIVEFAKHHKRSGYGKLLIIDHNFGFKTLFGHLNKIVVKQGDFVQKGQLVAYTGNSGMSNGPHLHYEVRYIGIVLDPINFVRWSLKNYNSIFKKEKKVKWQSLIKAMKIQKRLIQQQLSQKVAK
jgi:murein DD-endopeptidase MepM/ murein hydrolase activator NlpD